ncbi:MAG: hypothetical protein BRC26_03715, partial [Nanohaloarchaea archaeon QH_8_44_6]
MNKHAVKKLTKEGCIVGKEAAEDITDKDIEAIRDLDITPMYISETMLKELREKRKESNSSALNRSSKPNGSSPNGCSGQKTVQKKDDASTGETENPQQSRKQEETSVEQESPSENSEPKRISTDDANSSKANQEIEILDKRDRNEMDTKVEVMDEKEISKDEKDVPEFLQYYNDRYDKMKKLLM